jgi:serine/threonine protein kinase, bacterial
MLDAALDHVPADIDEPPSEWLPRVGAVFAEFGALTQDSGNVSYGVRIAGRPFFVKTAGLPEDPKPFLKHDQRVRLLRNAIDLRHACSHRLLPALHRVVESPHGPLLIYAWAEGTLLRGALDRFRHLPVEQRLAALDAIYDLHRQLAAQGWLMEDFYDGCLIYDFDGARLQVIDLDHYRRGPKELVPGPRFGSSRFMAPEESQPGSAIDERTTVYSLGRTAAVLLSDGTLARAAFAGSDALLAIATRACQADRAERYADVAAFVHAWNEARSA